MIFARVPVPGEVKTRLIPALGAEGACTLYARLVERTLLLCKDAGFASTQLWLSGSAQDNPRCKHWCGHGSCTLHIQQGAELGARMRQAFSSALRGHGAAVMIGCDCPGLLREDLTAARTALKGGCDAVLGACEDGGYYLLGLRKACPGLFSDMQWGGAGVAAETRHRLRAAGRRVHELEVRWDVDRPEDLRRLEGLAREDAECPPDNRAKNPPRGENP